MQVCSVRPGTTLATGTPMHARALSRLLKVRHRSLELTATEHGVVRDRKVTATGLTLFSVVLAVVMGIQWGVAGLACYLPWLPFAFVLLWGSTTALRFDEREEKQEEHPTDLPRKTYDELRHAGAHGAAR